MTGQRTAKEDSEGFPGAPDAGSAAVAAVAAMRALRAQRRQVWLLTACAVALLLAAVAWFEWHERTQELDTATTLSQRRAARLADDVAQALAVAKVAIAQIETRLQAAPAGTPLVVALGEAARPRAELLGALALPFELHALDAAGRVLHLADARPGSAQAGHNHVRPPPTRAGGGWAADIAQGSVGARVVPLQRAAAPNAHGVAAFSVDLDHAALLARLGNARSAQGGGAAVFRIDPDGSTTLLARAPHSESELGQRVRGPLAQSLVRAPSGVFRAETQFDRTHRTVAYQRLPGDAATLVVAYGLATDAVLAEWTGQLPAAVAIALLLAAGIVWGGWRLDQSVQAVARSRQALERSENHFRALAENLPDTVVRFDPAGRHLYANAAVEGATGLPPAAFIGKTNDELGMPRDTVAVWTATLQRVFASGKAERLEFSYPGPDGQRHWESRVVREPASAGAAATVLVISRDMTARKTGEQARERLNRHLLGLLDGMSDAFVSLDRQWRCQHVNQKAGELFGRDPASLLDKHIWTEFPQGVGQPFQRACEHAMNEGVAARLEAFYPPFNAWFENRIQPTPDGISVFFTNITERKQREAELKELHATLDALVEGSTDAIFVKDRQGRYVVANRAMATLLGRPLTEIVGAEDAALFPAALAERFRADDRRVMVSGLTETFEEPVATAQGERSHLTTKGALRIDGEVRGVFAISRDITERQRATEALRRSEQRLLQAQRTAHLGHWELDLRTGALLWSDEIYRILELDPARFDVTYEAFLDMVDPDDRPAVDAAYQQSLLTRQPYAITHRVRLADGRVKHLHEQCESTFDADGRALRSLGTVQDVTERVVAEQALRESEARHRELFEANPHPMWVYDLATLGFLAVNDAAVRQYGYSREAFLGMTLKDIRPPEDVARLLDNVAQVQAREGIDEAGVWRHLTRDGRLLDVEITSHLLDFQGRPAELVLAHDITRRLLGERALRDSEERLRLALQAANQGLYDLDLRTGGAVVSPEYARMLGWEPEEFDESNAAWRERLHPDDSAAVTQAFEDYIAGRVGEYRVEFRQRTKEGQWKWILSLGKVQERDAQGQPLRMLGTHTDITEARQAQAALRASGARLAYLLRNSPAVIYTASLSEDYAATYYSPNLREMLGWAPEDFIQDRSFWLDHVHEDDRAAVLAQMDALQVQDEVVLEYRFQHRDGRWCWMRDAVRQTRDEAGHRAELVGSWIDITARREAEEEVRRLAVDLEQRVHERTAELARSEARYRTIFETVPVSIGEEDWTGVQRLLRGLREAGVSDGPAYFAAHPEFVRQCLRAVKVLRLNRKALSLHEVSTLDAPLTGLQTFYPSPDDLPQFVGEIEALWQGQRLYSARKSLPAVTGRRLSLMMTMSLPGVDETDGTALVCLVDITEIDRLNAELDRSMSRLRQANKELETFTYSVSHDLKAPLRGIDGYSRLLLTDHQASLDDEGRKFLGHIRQATQHMGVLIDDLLAYSRLERRDMSLGELRLAPLLEAVLGGYRSEVAAQGVEWQVEVDPTLTARGDAQGLTIALRNLIDNALKFSRHSRPARIRIGATRSAGGVQLTVQDNGQGFDMKFHDRIFAIFQRLHRAEEYPGTGVGLAIVRKAMERMGGRVWGESQPGQGATFTLELPEAT